MPPHSSSKAATPLQNSPAKQADGEYDVVAGGTPGGVSAAVAAARGGCSVLLLERTAHVGGLVANGLGATEIATRGATGGIFMEFVRGNLEFYQRTYGKDSQQLKDCDGGYHFEPSAGEKTIVHIAV